MATEITKMDDVVMKPTNSLGQRFVSHVPPWNDPVGTWDDRKNKVAWAARDAKRAQAKGMVNVKLK